MNFFTLREDALKKSTAYHPQLDGQMEIANKVVEIYIRYMCSRKPSTWV